MKSIDRYRNAQLTLDELCSAAARLLASAQGSTDARVQAVPDARTVRYYQSTGLVDRPLRYDGRQATYGLRHLLQAVATKRLQAHGLSLAQVQKALAGRTDAELEAALTGDAPPAIPAPAAPPSRVATAARAWIAGEVADGVIVTIDPSRVSDPAALLARIREQLTSGGRP